MTSILVVNGGSSSVKLRVLSAADEITAALDIDQWDGSPDHGDLRQFINDQSGVDAVGHRVAHGGSRFTRATVIDDSVRAQLPAWPTWRRCTSRAPCTASPPPAPCCPAGLQVADVAEHERGVHPGTLGALPGRRDGLRREVHADRLPASTGLRARAGRADTRR
jgi:hypothetical protein